MAPPGDEEVAGFDVPVNDPFCVGGIQSVGDFDGDIQNAVERHGLAGDGLLSVIQLGPKIIHFDFERNLMTWKE